MTKNFSRPSGRPYDELRKITLTAGYARHAEGSCLAQFGNTHVLCTASLGDRVPPFLRNTGKGWVTAEYGMLPRATHQRTNREAAAGKQSGRTQEIQRLIGRSLRAITDLNALGERQIKIDCDVLQADGGTRTAAITGAWVALMGAVEVLLNQDSITKNPIQAQCAAISCGIIQQHALLDLDYDEDSTAEVDANFVLTDHDTIVEIQASAEADPFPPSQLHEMLTLAQKGAKKLFAQQRTALAALKP